MSCSVYEWGLDRGQECLFSRHQNFFSLVFSFPRIWEVLWNPQVWQNLQNSWALGNPCVLQPLLGGWLWIGHQVVRNIVRSLFSIFITSRSSSSICFVILLNCLYLKTTTFTFCPFSSPSHCGERERWAICCLILIASCEVKPWQPFLEPNLVLQALSN